MLFRSRLVRGYVWRYLTPGATYMLMVNGFAGAKPQVSYQLNFYSYIPVPPALALFLTGLGALIGLGRRRRGLVTAGTGGARVAPRQRRGPCGSFGGGGFPGFSGREDGTHGASAPG